MDLQVFSIQRDYPQIYNACHRDHRTRDRSVHGVTSHEAGILAHISRPEGLTAGDLARHLGIGPSSVSARLKRLGGLGLVQMVAGADARLRIVRLTDKGRAALADDSVLDGGRLVALLALLSPDERWQAVAGMALLGKAARMLKSRGGTRSSSKS